MHCNLALPDAAPVLIPFNLRLIMYLLGTGYSTLELEMRSVESGTGICPKFMVYCWLSPEWCC